MKRINYGIFAALLTFSIGFFGSQINNSLINRLEYFSPNRSQVYHLRNQSHPKEFTRAGTNRHLKIQ